MTEKSSNRKLSIFKCRLGMWNVYFLCKFALSAMGFLHLNLFYNACLFLAVLIPLPKIFNTVRQILCVIAGVLLLYYEAYFSGGAALRKEMSALSKYPVETLLNAVTSPTLYEILGCCVFILVLYLFIRHFVRVGTFTIGYFLCLVGAAFFFQPSDEPAPVIAHNASPIEKSDADRDERRAPAAPSWGVSPLQPPQEGAPSNRNINNWLNAFYEAEETRRAQLPDTLRRGDVPFDIIFIEVSSLSWDDLQADELSGHPVFGKFDIGFNNFNSVTSYGGSATLRLLGSMCGQPSHDALYSGRRLECELMNKLDDLGYTQFAFSDDEGNQDNWLRTVKEYGALRPAFESQRKYKQAYQTYDGEKIYSSKDVFDSYLNRISQNNPQRAVSLLRFSILQDGNRRPGSRTAVSHQTRAKQFLDDVNEFLLNLQRSGRKAMVVFVPEHGAAVRGDSFQMEGLRGIPSPHITKIPVLVKFVNIDHDNPSIQVLKPSSYLALTETIGRVLANNFYSSATPITLKQLVQDLPQTWMVSENGEASVVEFKGKDYVKLGRGEWMPYGE